VSWKRPFENPIPLLRGRVLVTLQDAADYIMKLPKADGIYRNGRPPAKLSSWRRKAAVR
jgi:hypothetical protein